MNPGFIAQRDLGYVQAPAGTFDTAKTLLAAGVTIPAGTSEILFSCEAQAIRWRSDNTAPTAAIGNPLAVVTQQALTAAQLGQLQIIAQVAGAILNFQFFGQ